MRYLSLDASKVAHTIETLRRRISERFPDSGLSRVAADLVAVGKDVVARSERIRKPHRLLHAGAALLIFGFFALAALALSSLRIRQEDLTVSDIIQNADSLLGSMVFIGASVIFLMTIDTRLKRRRVLGALHELRSLAHIIDMYQLTKDPESIIGGGTRTASSPTRAMTRFELARYLDYSSEMLSLISKLAAIYVQGFADPVVLAAVDQVEALTNGLSRKIWQKIMIVDRFAAGEPVDEHRGATG